MTSHDVVMRARRILKMKRIGHTGTLDPDVEGVLVLCLGQATKLVELLMESGKVYQGRVSLGLATETEDRQGRVVTQEACSTCPSSTQVDQAMANFQGLIEQVPPYYSAVKVQGKRLYEYARQGLTVERPRRQVRIDSFERTSPIETETVFVDEAGMIQPLSELNSVDHPATIALCSWNFHVVCGKGTYVRTLAVDLGQALGYPAHMAQLTRLVTSGCKADQAITLAQLAEASEAGQVTDHLIPIEQVLKDYPRVQIDDEGCFLVANGQVLKENYFGVPVTGLVTIYDGDQLIAIYQPHPTKPGLIKPYKMFQGLTSTIAERS